MRRTERLVQVEVQYVNSKHPRRRPANQRIKVGAVHVEQGAAVVDLADDFFDLALEHAESTWQGQHEGRDVGA